MPEQLVFSIHAPLASWGEIAGGEARPSANRPTRSAILGLVAACLGIRRGDEDSLRRTDRLRVAVRVDEAGLPLHDYHTTQVPKSRKGVRYRTRRDELYSAPRADISTILSSRAYRMEISACVVLSHGAATAEDAVVRFELAEIADAMRRPVFAPYLGRRSCPLARPLDPQIVNASDFVSACSQVFASRSVPESPEGAALDGRLADRQRWYWEDGCHTPIAPERSHRRHDLCTSHSRRLFAERIEHEAVVRSADIGDPQCS
jgi:CRISPR system Cascade subunit CasD